MHSIVHYLFFTFFYLLFLYIIYFYSFISTLANSLFIHKSLYLCIQLSIIFFFLHFSIYCFYLLSISIYIFFISKLINDLLLYHKIQLSIYVFHCPLSIIMSVHIYLILYLLSIIKGFVLGIKFLILI